MYSTILPTSVLNHASDIFPSIAFFPRYVVQCLQIFSKFLISEFMRHIYRGTLIITDYLLMMCVVEQKDASQ